MRTLVKDLNLNDKVLIYPGADEVPLALLSRAVVDHFEVKPKVKLVYRN